MADWFHAPEITEVDASQWHGAAGQPIRVRAEDDVQVTQVNVVITDTAGVVLEQGAAVQAGDNWWTYTPQRQRLVIPMGRRLSPNGKEELGRVYLGK